MNKEQFITGLKEAFGNGSFDEAYKFYNEYEKEAIPYPKDCTENQDRVRKMTGTLDELQKKMDEAKIADKELLVGQRREYDKDTRQVWNLLKELAYEQEAYGTVFANNKELRDIVIDKLLYDNNEAYSWPSVIGEFIDLYCSCSAIIEK